MMQIKVEYYNEEHKDKLKKCCSRFSGMEQLVNGGISFSKEELFSFCVFKHQKLSQPDMKTYKGLQKYISDFNRSWEHYFDFSNNSIKSKYLARELDNSITETMGVGMALILANRIYDLEEPDWQKVPTSSKKDTDFQIASTGKKFIEIEAKGSVVDKHGKISKISKHKKSIIDKKDVQQKKEKNKNELIGIISAFPSDPTLIAKSYLLDPPAKEISFDPFKYKLLARLYYYWRNLRVLSRAHIVEILINRIEAIRRLDCYQSLDKMPLLNRNNRPHPIPDSLFDSRSVTKDRAAFGETVPLTRKNDKYFFYGLHRNLVGNIVKQDFDEICSAKYETFVQRNDIILAKIPKNIISDYGLRDRDDGEDKKNSRKLIQMKGDIYYLSSGKVIGFVKPL